MAFAWRRLIICAAAMLAACGGSQPPIGAPDAMPQSRATAPHAEHGGSWMLPAAKSSDLLYATGGCSGTCVLSYPDGKIVGSLTTSGQSVCTDSTGNVFITQSDQVVEYTHGGTSPVATLSLPGGDATGCSVDPTTGNLAVVFFSSEGNVAIFAGERGQPTLYGANISASYCGYDNAGDLFVNGFANQDAALSELPAGGSSFTKFSIDQKVGVPGQMQWDGSYMTWQSNNVQGGETVSRLAFNGSQVSIVGTTHLKGIKLQPHQSWIYNGVILVPFSQHGAKSNKIGIWAYPEGGKAKRLIRNFGSYNRNKIRFLGLAISIAP
jgi:hypothetical protein